MSLTFLFLFSPVCLHWQMAPTIKCAIASGSLVVWLALPKSNEANSRTNCGNVMVGTVKLWQYILRVILVLCLNVILLVCLLFCLCLFLWDKTFLYQDRAQEIKERSEKEMKGIMIVCVGPTEHWRCEFWKCLINFMLQYIPSQTAGENDFKFLTVTVHM